MRTNKSSDSRPRSAGVMACPLLLLLTLSGASCASGPQPVASPTAPEAETAHPAAEPAEPAEPAETAQPEAKPMGFNVFPSVSADAGPGDE